jgi:hypothetical protein
MSVVNARGLMNVTWLRLKPVIAELRAIRNELARLADCWEQELADKGIYPQNPKTDTSGAEPTVQYVDETEDWIQEQMEAMKPYVQREDHPEPLRKD